MTALYVVGGVLAWLVGLVAILAVLSGNHHGTLPSAPDPTAPPPHDPESCLTCRRRTRGAASAPGSGPGSAGAAPP